jgi:hypothetical protein
MNHSSKIFEILGVKPNKNFKIKVAGSKEVADYDYFISDNLSVYYHSAPGCVKKSEYTIQHFIRGDVKIVKIVKSFIVTSKEKAAIDYARACDCKWIARDRGSDLWAYNYMPIKADDYWYWQDRCVPIWVDISFIKWEDKEPFYIGPEVIFKVNDKK